jgi:Rrf2 family transcriptional regulator, cysteine metabolism repressor
MKLSLRSEHALLSLIQLARHSGGENPTLVILAASQQIPAEPLAEILSVLNRCKYVKQAKGSYRLAKSPDKISVAEIIRLFDGALAPLEPVSEKGYNPSPMEQEEKLTDLFTQIQEQISERLEGTSLADLS